MMATDQDNRPLHTVFQLLPSRKVREEHYHAHITPELVHTGIRRGCFGASGLCVVLIKFVLLIGCI
jgi:hypothetical protein